MAEPKSLVKSRAALQALSKQPHRELTKYSLFDYILKDIWENIRLFTQTYHRFQLSKYMTYGGYSNFFKDGILDEAVRLELIEILKKEYPGCDIQYIKYVVTTTPGEMIMIDWS